MAKLKCCDWKPVPYTGLHAREKHAAAIGHTNGGGTDKGSLYGFWVQNAKGERGAANLHIGAHFQVKKVGRPEQYVDTDFVIYHAYGASEFAVGIEVEDDSNPSTPMNANQIAGIVAILKELKVPARLLTSSNPGDGLGYHEQFTAWNQSGHACPGTVRTKQWENEVIPALKKAQQPKAWKPRTLPASVRIAMWVVVRWLESYVKRAEKGPVHPLATVTRDNLHRLSTDISAADEAGAK